MPTIRPYDEADHAAVTSLGERLTRGARPWRDPERWQAVVRGWVAEAVDAADQHHVPSERPHQALLVATEDDRVVGFIALATRLHATGDVDAYVDELAVDVAVERRGIGRALLRAGEAWAREGGFAVLTLDTGGSNEQARALYRAEGFVEEDVRLTKPLS